MSYVAGFEFGGASHHGVLHPHMTPQANSSKAIRIARLRLILNMLTRYA